MILNKNDKAKLVKREDIGIIRAFAGGTRSAYEDYRLDTEDFLYQCSKTPMFWNFENEYCVYTQGDHCIAGKLIDEIEKISNRPIKKADFSIGDIDVARWMGYTLMYWKIQNEVKEGKISPEIINAMYIGYETLHTQSMNYAIENLFCNKTI